MLKGESTEPGDELDGTEHLLEISVQKADFFPCGTLGYRLWKQVDLASVLPTPCPQRLMNPPPHL